MDKPVWYDQGAAYTKQREGFRSDVYTDTEGIPTVGYGFNLQAHPELPTHMSEQQASQTFDPLYGEAIKTAQTYAGQRWAELHPTQQMALVDMAYNLHKKLFQFKNMQQGIQSGDDAKVTQEMKNSNWYNQVKSRGKMDVGLWNK